MDKGMCYNTTCNKSKDVLTCVYISGCGEIGRRARLRGVWETLWVRVPPSAPNIKTSKVDTAFLFLYRGNKN